MRVWVLAAAMFLLAGGQAYAWGYEGHKVVALLAAERLSPRAKAQVAELLDVKDAAAGMEQYAPWADEIRRSRPETSHWHYVDIEIGSNGYDAARDCPDDDCVVGQIKRDIAILQDKTLAKPVRAEALRFLIHFVGDVHQPLHSADNHDRGGNDISVQVPNKATNMHSLWDTAAVQAIGPEADGVAALLSPRISPELAAQWSKSTPEQWANESFALANSEIYAKFGGPGGTMAPIILPVDYLAKEGPVTAAQLAKAGVRLAAVLNAALR